MSHVPTVLKSDRSVFDKMLPVDDNEFFMHSLYSKLTCSKNYFRNTIRVSNGLDLDQDQHFVGPDLGPNYLQRLLADGKSYHFQTKG